MGKRFLAAAIGVPMIFAVVFLGKTMPIFFDIAVAIICVVSVGEFVSAVKGLKLLYLSIPSLVFAAAYPMLLTYGYEMITCFVYSGVMLSMIVFFHKKITYKDLAYIYAMTIIITVALSTIVMIKNLYTPFASFYFLIALGMPWMADIGAFFAGTFLGKHKLCPEISPKKTVEGAVGGVLFCIGATCFLSWLLPIIVYGSPAEVNYVYVVCMSFIGSFLSIIGDLSFSIVKRNFNIKDYGSILPGHGGFLDRFDSVIFVSPFILVFITYFPIAG
ncbi:MAG: phosphatidate cytidylyltransferase [Clostridia bacterium]|nr:phosphatidate cytidylyltransferase [Clostridia bacterium]